MERLTTRRSLRLPYATFLSLAAAVSTFSLVVSIVPHSGFAGTSFTAHGSAMPAPLPAILCVNPSGGGCFLSIQAAIDAAAPGDVIDVAPGTYNEQVAINKTITLRGANAGIDARSRTGAGESIITHADGPVQILADDVVVDGFTIQGASTDPSLPPFSALGAGVWTNPSFSVTNGGHRIQNNIIQDNIIGLYLNNTSAIQSVVRRNLFRNNNLDGPAGGRSIYSDLVIQNAVIDENSFTGDGDAGIFLAGSLGLQSDITISNNVALNERLLVLFNTTSCVISGNTVTGSPFSSGIIIAGGNDGVMIRSNALINNLNFGLRIGDFIGSAPNSNISVDHNRIVGNPSGGLLVDPAGYTGVLDAQNNWWGCNAGPGLSGCDTVTAADSNVDFNPWLVLTLSASPTTIARGATSAVTASLNRNSDGVDTSGGGAIPNTTPAVFGATLGSINPINTSFSSGQAPATFTAGSTAGSATVSVTVDNQTVSVTIIIDAALGFDFCVQDDVSRSTLRFNSASGIYEFRDCKKGTLVTGQGTVTLSPGAPACKITLTDKSSKSPIRTVTALVNVCTFVGEATINIPSLGLAQMLRDKDIRNNTCVCP